MPDILNARAEQPAPPRPHPVLDAIIAAGRAAAERRDQHHALGAPLRRMRPSALAGHLAALARSRGAA